MLSENSIALSLRRVLIAILGLASCGWLAWYSVRIGYARTLAKVATITSISAVADRAVELSPTDAETHFTRGELLEQTERYEEAADELGRAVRLRPRDYYLWLEFGMAQDQIRNQERALRAFREAIALAPAYANARWQLGNLLLRMGQDENAFVELHKASSSSPLLLPNVTDLAWGVYKGNPSAVEAALTPNSDAEHEALDLAANKLPGVRVETADPNKLALELGGPEFQKQ